MRRFTLPATLLLFVLLLVHVAVWWVPVSHSLRFCTSTAETYSQDGGLNALADLRHARWLRAAYLAAATVSLGYAVVGSLFSQRFVLALCAAQWLLPLWLVWRQPEEIIVFTPSAAHLIATACALGFGGYLLHQALGDGSV